MNGTEYVNAILKRLQQQYLHGVEAPNGEPLTLTRLYRLYRYATAEGYGAGEACPLLRADEPYPALPHIKRDGGTWAAQVWWNVYRRHLLGHRLPWNGQRVASWKVWGVLAQAIQSEQYPADMDDDERKAA